MKNIHIIPTDKPSRLFKDDNQVLNLYTHSILKGIFTNGIGSNQHIYITSDEEIKVGDWVITPTNDIIEWTKVFHPIGKKIILTTNTKLIRYGVQAIDDEFLEWFVKNPSCEWIEVKRNKKLSNKSIWNAIEGDLIFNNHNCGGIITILSSDVRVHITSENGEGYMETAITSDNGIDTLVINNYKVYEYTDYKIIFPKEEPCTCTDECFGYLTKTCKRIEEPKQETLEEAALRLYSYVNDDIRLLFIAGAKWQAEKMYSEEEVLNILGKYNNHIQENFDPSKTILPIREWFEQFKKK